MADIWLDGIMGVVTGDALGCPVQFAERDEIRECPVTGMEGYGTYNMPEGTWTDDSSMTLALLASIRERGAIDPEDIMVRFVGWLVKGEYTPFGESFDIGGGTMAAINRYIRERDIKTCGGTTDHDNGNGSLMRILPACLYAYEKKMSDADAVKMIHEVAGLTHNHIRGQIACGLYYFCAKEILDGEGELIGRLQDGLDKGFKFYEGNIAVLTELAYYGRLRDVKELASLPEENIKSGGYVVESIEAAIWSLATTETFEECLLKAVNLGYDTDSVAAIAGGLAGLYYGYESIPGDWLSVIKRREWIEDMCRV